MTTGWRLLGPCDDATTGGVVGIVIGVIVLAAAGVGVWWLVKKRHG